MYDSVERSIRPAWSGTEARVLAGRLFVPAEAALARGFALAPESAWSEPG